MKRIFFSLLTGVVGCALALQFPAAAVAKSKERVIFSFDMTTGVFPEAGLTDIKGTLYVGASEGGGASCQNYDYGCGTAVAVNTKSGAGTVLYIFCAQQNCTDGDMPEANLLDVKGTFYGTTYVGGKSCTTDFPPGCGTVFSLNPATGAETVLHSFGSGTDGAFPTAGLIDVKGTLYGTTPYGGTGCYNSNACGQGTVFSINPSSGAEAVVYSFCSQKNCTDGNQPTFAGLIDVDDRLYGTTIVGGASGGGTVFMIDPKTGAETVVHSFGGSTDGENPIAGLIEVNGILYGTTSEGGDANCQNYCGTVFSVNPKTGAEKVLHSFGGSTDGAYPEAGVISMKGMLYGTTAFGTTNGHEHHCADCGGTVFSVNPRTGAETVLYSFCSKKKCRDGKFPFAGLIAVNGTLYGTTYVGGAYDDGTVFAITP